MGLKALIQIVSPPSIPLDTGNNEGWLKLESSLDLVLPDDYKEYIAVYGSGEIGGFIFPLNPFSASASSNLLRRSKVILDSYREIKEKYGDRECPYPLYPEAGGLFPWGVTENGDTLFWLTHSEPDSWPVVINESRGPAYEKYNESMTGFLVKILTGEIVSEILPDDLPNTQNMFLQIK